MYEKMQSGRALTLKREVNINKMARILEFMGLDKPMFYEEMNLKTIGSFESL